MMYYFVVAAFLLFLFVFWYLSDSVRALEGDMNTQMMYIQRRVLRIMYIIVSTAWHSVRMH